MTMIFVAILVILVGGSALWIWSVRKKLIENVDQNGVITKSGTRHAWSDLVHIEYHMVWQGGAKKLRSLHFHFKTGVASAGYLTPSMGTLLATADRMNVPKSEKLVGSMR